MDRSQRAKAAAKAAQEILENPKTKDVLKLQAAKLIFEYESEQAKLAEERAQRRAAKEDQSAEVARLRQENKALRAELETLKAKQPGEPDCDPVATFYAQYREKASASQVATESSAAKVVSTAPAPLTPAPAPAVALDPKLAIKSETILAAIQPPHPSLQAVIEHLDGKRQAFTPAPAPRNPAEITERERQIAAAEQRAREVQPIVPPDPLDAYIAELPPIMDADDVPMPSDSEYLEALREGNRALDKALSAPRFRPLVSNAIPDDAV